MVDVVGKKWAVCVVTLIGRYGVVRFGAIQRTLPRVSPATLTATLRALESAKLVRRLPVPSGGDTRGYALTESGQALYTNLLPLANWLRTASPIVRPGRASPRPLAQNYIEGQVCR